MSELSLPSNFPATPVPNPPTHHSLFPIWTDIRNRASFATLFIPRIMSTSWLQRKRKSELLELAQQANLPEYVVESSIHVQIAACTE
jgi:hypothetical protein